MKNTFCGMSFCLFVLLVCSAPRVSAAETVAEHDGSRVLHIVATTFPLWLVVRNITAGAPGVEADRMIPAQAGCPHDYTLTPQDMRKLNQADILVENGLGMEAFLRETPTFPREGSGLYVIDSSAGLDALLPDGEGDNKEDGRVMNPHLFASPRMAARLVDNIGRRLAEKEPVYAEIFQKNALAYAASLNRLADCFDGLGERTRNNRIVTQHGVFDYLARDAGLSVVATVRSHDAQEPAAAEMVRLTRDIRARDAGAIFTEPQYSTKVGRTLASETGVPLASLDPVASGPEDAPLDYYEQVMTANLRTLETTLGIR